MYSEYISYIKYINFDNFDNFNFKSNQKYNSILEHVSYEDGVKYAELIIKEFPNIHLDDILKYIEMNDKYGYPKLYNIHIYNKKVNCSTTSLRYVYHALVILEYYKKTGLTKIVEVGCGYGGLFLALDHFSRLLNIDIHKYYIIDLPEVCNLIKIYLKAHNVDSNKFFIHDATLYGSDINDDNLFFISNYCFTEIDYNKRIEYLKNLINKTSNGFIIWQTIFDKTNINNIVFPKKIIYSEERPQTASIEYKNYFVYY